MRSGGLVMKNISTAIPSLPRIQEGQLSITGERMCTIKVLVNLLGVLPRNSVTALEMTLKSVEGP